MRMERCEGERLMMDGACDEDREVMNWMDEALDESDLSRSLSLLPFLCWASPSVLNPIPRVVERSLQSKDGFGSAASINGQTTTHPQNHRERKRMEEGTA
jgi:hypothetical protein